MCVNMCGQIYKEGQHPSCATLGAPRRLRRRVARRRHIDEGVEVSVRDINLASDEDGAARRVGGGRF